MFLKTLDDLFTYIQAESLTVVLFLESQSNTFKPIEVLIENNPAMAYFIVDAESIDVLQMVRFPQMRIFKNGVEVKSILGEEILKWKKHLKEFY